MLAIRKALMISSAIATLGGSGGVSGFTWDTALENIADGFDLTNANLTATRTGGVGGATMCGTVAGGGSVDIKIDNHGPFVMYIGLTKTSSDLMNGNTGSNSVGLYIEGGSPFAGIKIGSAFPVTASATPVTGDTVRMTWNKTTKIIAFYRQVASAGAFTQIATYDCSASGEVQASMLPAVAGSTGAPNIQVTIVDSTGWIA